MQTVEGGKIICNNMNLCFQPGELIAILGVSGGGKSTLMKLLCGLNEPSSGKVFVNNSSCCINLHENYDSLKSIVGYVPQSDIVHDNLSLSDMLLYAAKLRFEDDDLVSRRVNEVISTVNLQGHEKTLISRLSGGQCKRASIAVELLSRPKLFFLDEPTSGLDPATEYNLMGTLKDLTTNEKGGATVIFITHSLSNLKNCDKIVFLGEGGNLWFYGGYDEMIRFFSEYTRYHYEPSDAIRDKDKSEFEKLVVQVLRSPKKAIGMKDVYARKYSMPISSHIEYVIDSIEKPDTQSFIRQTYTLLLRNTDIIVRDKIRVLITLALAPLLGFLIYLVADGSQFEDFYSTRSLLLALACSAFFIGLQNSIQEVCKERDILIRESMAGMGMGAYITSKVLTFLLICFIQSLLLVSIFAWRVGLPVDGIITTAFIEIFVATNLTALVASAKGILVSSMFTPDRAMVMVPLILIPQMLFAGVIFPFQGITETLSFVTVSRWAMQSYGTTLNLNELDAVLAGGISFTREHEYIFEFTQSNILFAWGVMIFAVILFVCLSIWQLRKINKGQKLY